MDSTLPTSVSDPVAPPAQNQTTAPSSPSGGKEQEALSGSSVTMEAVSPDEVDIPTEVSEAGVEAPEAIDVPLDVQKLGVQPSGASQQMMIQSPVGGGVVLPISDDQVVKGLHEQILSSLRWLAEICRKQLKRVHFTLRVIHGKVFRVPTHNAAHA